QATAHPAEPRCVRMSAAEFPLVQFKSGGDLRRSGKRVRQRRVRAGCGARRGRCAETRSVRRNARGALVLRRHGSLRDGAADLGTMGEGRKGLVMRIVAVLLSALALCAGSARAQSSSSPIRLIVGVTAGASTDLVARLVADKLQGLLNDTVIVDNKPGAG